jgi:hypothetical protein
MRLVATRGFSDHIFGFFWNYLEIFDLDGHNLGTIRLSGNAFDLFFVDEF